MDIGGGDLLPVVHTIIITIIISSSKVAEATITRIIVVDTNNGVVSTHKLLSFRARDSRTVASKGIRTRRSHDHTTVSAPLMTWFLYLHMILIFCFIRPVSSVDVPADSNYMSLYEHLVHEGRNIVASLPTVPDN